MNISKTVDLAEHWSMDYMGEAQEEGAVQKKPRALTLKYLLNVHRTESTVVAFGTVGGTN